MGTGHPRVHGAGALIALALAVAVPFLPERPATPSADTIVLSLDVGQGDATWVGLPCGRSVLIDAGPAGEDRDSGERVVEPALRAEGRGRLDAAILSHAHLDHFGGFPWLASRGWFSRWVENGSDPRAAWRRTIASALRARQGARIEIARDTLLGISDAESIRIFRGFDGAGENDRSIAALVGRGDRSILLAGDLEMAGEAALLPRLVSVGVLKAPTTGAGRRAVLRG